MSEMPEQRGSVSRLDSLPVSGSFVASLPKEEVRSVSRLQKYFHEQYVRGLAKRKHHAVAWMMVNSYLRGIHYFRMTEDGMYIPIKPQKDKPRGVVPVIKPMYRHVLGLMDSNSFGVTCETKMSDADGFYRAKRNQSVLENWARDTRFEGFRGLRNQVLLREGMFGALRYIDRFRQNVFVRGIRGSEIFPIPYDARTPDECDGFIIAAVATKQWLEMQDESYKRQTGKEPGMKMAQAARNVPGGYSVNLPSLGMGGVGTLDGAITLSIYMKETEALPGGMYAFQIDDTMYRMAAGVDANGQPQTRDILFNGQVPLEITYADKVDDDFWGYGLCESMIPAQKSIDRQKTQLETNAKRNRAQTFVDAESIQTSDVQDEDAPFITFKPTGYTAGSNKPIFHFPARPVGTDSLTLLQSGMREADLAAGMRSGIIFGQQEGRTESGPATSLLSQNASASMTTMLKNIRMSDDNMFPQILDMLQQVWPEEKTIEASETVNIGRELRVAKGTEPWSKGVKITARPMLAGGVQTFVNMLFELMRLPGADGKPGTLLTRRELFKGLRSLGFLPPGLDLEETPEARIQGRVNLLIGDGMQPKGMPATSQQPGEQALETSRIAVDMFKKAILDPTYQLYSPMVKKALLAEFDFHSKRLYGATTHPNQFDDDLDRMESAQSEQFIRAAEADLDTLEGDFVPAIGV